MKTTTINDFDSWQETHFEIVSSLVKEYKNSTVVLKQEELNGTGGLYLLARDLTFEFETLNKDKAWESDYFDELENFLDDKLT
jgi:hypothetical protein